MQNNSMRQQFSHLVHSVSLRDNRQLRGRKGIGAFKTLVTALAALAPMAAHAQRLVVNDAWVNQNGNIVSGSYQGGFNQDGSTYPAISIQTAQPVTIINATVSGPGKLIDCEWGGAQVTVKNTSGFGSYPAAGQAVGQFIYTYTAATVDIENCFAIQTQGILIVDSGNNNDPRTTTSVKILYNQLRNADGRHSNGSGGYSGNESTPTAIQLNAVRGAAAEIAWNECSNDAGNSFVTDIINLYQSSGTSTSNRIRVHDNLVQGSSMNYGSGINIGDSYGGLGPDVSGGFQEAYNNRAIAITHTGIQLIGGHDNIVHDNLVVSTGYNGSFGDSNGVGISAWDEYNQGSGTFYNNSVYNNTSGFLRDNGSGGSGRSDYWLSSPSWDNLEGGGNVGFSGGPNNGDQDNTFIGWRQLALQHGTPIGNNLLLDGSFEGQTSGSLSSPWSLDGQGSAGVDRQWMGEGDYNNSYIGGYANAWAHTDGSQSNQWAAVQQTVNVTPGNTYTLTFYTLDVNNNIGNNAAYHIYDPNTYANFRQGNFSPGQGGYAQQTATFTAASGETQVNISIGYNSSANSWMRIDDVVLTDPLKKPTAAPSGVSAVAGSSGTKKITVSWSKYVGATSYRIYRATSSGGAYTQIALASGSATSYTNTGLSAGTTYYYRVAANNGVGAGPQSAIVSAKAQ